MPLYDYQCSVCEHIFELVHGFNQPTVQKCPMCEGDANRKLHSVPVIYKGTGFYTTDYARKQPGGGSSSGSSSSSSSDAQSESSSDSSKSASEDAGSSTKSDSTKPSDSPKDSSSKPSTDS